LSLKTHVIFIQGQPQGLVISFKGPAQANTLSKNSAGNTG